MFAAAFTKYGAADVLTKTEVPKPTASEGQIVVKNMAVGVNPIDFKVRAGALAPGQEGPEKRMIVGWDASGTVEEVGPKVSQFKVGDKVVYAGDLTKDGTYAQYTAIDARMVGKMPSSLSFEDAAALPLTFQTAWEAIVEQMFVREDEKNTVNKGKTIFILNGAGGVGAIGIQIAKYLGLTVIASASSEDSIAFVKKMGADFVVNHRQPSLADEFAKIPAIAGGKVNYVLNAFDNSRFAELLKLLQVDGKLTTVWKTTAEEWAQVDMDDIWFNRKSVMYALMFARPLGNYEQEVIGQIFNHMATLVDAGHIKTTATKTYGNLFADIAEAHKFQESGKVRGKQVLTVPH